MTTRRKFLAGISTAAAVSLTSSFPALSADNEKKLLVHHVFFWLKNPSSKEDLEKLLEGVNSLKKIETLLQVKIGTPAATTKSYVIDDSYNISLFTVFDDLKGHDVYQDHPTHQAFVKNYSSLWNKVVVYDSVDV